MNTFPACITIRHIFFFQVGIGISGNTLLLVIHTSTVFLDRRPKPTDLTISLLALTHIVMILTTVFMVSPDMSGSHSVQDDITCKAMLYLKTVMRGLSICTTCLLSVLQAITICPRSSWLAKFKHQPSYYIFCLFVVFFVLTTPISGIIIAYTSAIPNGTWENILVFNKYCVLWSMNYSHSCLMFLMITFRDGFFIVIMILSSGYMVIFLFRHKRQSQHLRSSCLSPRVSPETRATQNILMLMILFVVFNLFVFLSTLFWYVFYMNDPISICFQTLMVNGYSSVSSVLLISSNKRIIKVSFTLLWKNIQCLKI